MRREGAPDEIAISDAAGGPQSGPPRRATAGDAVLAEGRRGRARSSLQAGGSPPPARHPLASPAWLPPRAGSLCAATRHGREPKSRALKDDYHRGDETIVWPRSVPVAEPRRVN